MSAQVGGPSGCVLRWPGGRVQDVQAQVTYMGINDDGLHVFLIPLYEVAMAALKAGVASLYLDVLPPMTEVGTLAVDIDPVEWKRRNEFHA